MAAPRKGPRSGGLRGLLDGLTGARLCYGEPVINRERAVIPVARVRVAGGGGYGSGDEGDGGGGGGWVEATPSGFIEVGPSGAEYHAIPDPERLGRIVRAVVTLLVGVAVARGAFARRS